MRFAASRSTWTSPGTVAAQAFVPIDDHSGGSSLAGSTVHDAPASEVSGRAASTVGRPAGDDITMVIPSHCSEVRLQSWPLVCAEINVGTPQTWQPLLRG